MLRNKGRRKLSFPRVAPQKGDCRRRVAPRRRRPQRAGKARMREETIDPFAGSSAEGRLEAAVSPAPTDTAARRRGQEKEEDAEEEAFA